MDKKEELSKFNEDFIKNYDENGNIGYFLEVDIDYPKELFNLHKDLPFLPERKKVEKVEKLICSIEDKEKYVIHIRALKQALNHGLKLKKVHRAIQFIQKDWLKSYIDMNTELRKKAKNEFEKNFFKLMNNSVFGKTMENVRNHRDIKLVTSDKRRKRLVSEPNYHSHKKFSDHLMAIEMKKTRVKMTKPLYLGMSILDISKILMYEFWYDYINLKDCLYNNKTVYKSHKRFKSYYGDVYTEELNKIALSSNDDKRLQTSDRITTYPYGTNQMMMVNE